MSETVVSRASLAQVREAVDASADQMRATPGLELVEAVDLVCDYLRIPSDDDRRIVRKAVLRRLCGGGVHG